MDRRIRLWTGLVLFCFVTLHYLNHIAGLISISAMEQGLAVFEAIWGNPVGQILLYGSALTHMVIAFGGLFQRRTLAMPNWQAIQHLLGFAIPPLIILHIIGNRLAQALFGTENSYMLNLLTYFVLDRDLLLRQAAVFFVVWIHGCIGIHYWLRLRPDYHRYLPYLFALALLIPALAFVGVSEAGRDVGRMAENGQWLSETIATLNLPDSEGLRLLYWLEDLSLLIFGALVVTILSGRIGRKFWQRRHGYATLQYPDGKRVRMVPGTTILEASRSAGIPHAAVCGGRGRCSTCRVRIGAGLESLPPMSLSEELVLARINAPHNVRLACQTRPVADLQITPLLHPQPSLDALRGKRSYRQGQEREIAILFADLRGFTRLSEAKLPFDVVFILNRYFEAMGLSVTENGGRIDKFIGDGVMALFGVESDPARGCRTALEAARSMSRRIQEINESLSHDLDQPLKIGIGIHTGTVIVGEIGFANAVSVTAIGDAVNIASRLESLTKELAVQLVISAPVAEYCGIHFSKHATHEIELRGREKSLKVVAIADALDLPAHLEFDGTEN